MRNPFSLSGLWAHERLICAALAAVAARLSGAFGGDGGGPPPPMNSVYNSLLGVPRGTLPTASLVAFDVSALATSAGVAPAFAARNRAAAPATCGDAIDVPLIVFVAVGDVFHA